MIVALILLLALAHLSLFSVPYLLLECNVRLPISLSALVLCTIARSHDVPLTRFHHWSFPRHNCHSCAAD
uniref:Secreted protein n=1 Tax=Aegilops tauschii subsp. strangulata TaxID=200361 RepID=A0A453L740_AEGTS